MRIRGLAVFLAFAAGLVSALLSDDRSAPPPEMPAMAQEPPATSEPAPVPAGTPTVPMDFVLHDVGGRERSLASLVSKDGAVLYIYASGCSHCFQMLPRLVEPARRIGEKGIPVIGVQYHGSAGSMEEAVRSADVPGFLVADRNGAFCEAIAVGEYSLFVIDAEGRIRHRSNGDDVGAVEAMFPDRLGPMKKAGPGQLER